MNLDPHNFSQVLDALASRLGATADYLLPIFTRKAIFLATGELILLSCLLALWFGKVRYWPKKESDIFDPETMKLATGIVGFFILLFGGLLFLDALQIFASPEAEAIEMIMDAIRGGN